MWLMELLSNLLTFRLVASKIVLEWSAEVPMATFLGTCFKCCGELSEMGILSEVAIQEDR